MLSLGGEGDAAAWIRAGRQREMMFIAAAQNRAVRSCCANGAARVMARPLLHWGDHHGEIARRIRAVGKLAKGRRVTCTFVPW